MKKSHLGILIAFLVVGAVATTSGQVYPVRWQDASPLAPAVPSGVVALGDGGISMNPDQAFSTGTPGFNAAGLVFSHASCAAANRGEIRLWVLDGLSGGTTKIDALCLCREKDVSDNKTYAWSCFNTSVN